MFRKYQKGKKVPIEISEISSPKNSQKEFLNESRRTTLIEKCEKSEFPQLRITPKSTLP
jgi:hypothetical protein